MTGEYIVVPAWWDPKKRKAIFKDSTIVCGILVAGDRGIVFASLGGIEFEAPAEGLGVTWVKLGTACRFTIGQETYLVYLLPPTDGSPRLSQDASLQIAEWLGTADSLVELADRLTDLGEAADIFGLGGVLGNSIKTVSTVSALRQARSSRHALQHRFSSFNRIV